jgi:hypothetical protein
MTILITTIPNDPKEWAGWLEQHLVGLRLRDLIHELQMLPEPKTTPLSLLLNEVQLSEVRTRGLSALTVTQIRTLLGSPESLLELQEEVLCNGSDYWKSLPTAEEVRQSLERVKLKIKAAISVDERPSRPSDQPTVARSRSWFNIGILSLAVMLLIGVFVSRMQPVGSGRILGQPGLLANNVNSSSQYFNRIADAASEWFIQRPINSAQLISLLQDVSDDCQILIEAEHPALTTAERDWFVTKCGNWKTEFDITLSSLQSGDLTLEAAQAAVDQTMRKLVNALRKGQLA